MVTISAQGCDLADAVIARIADVERAIGPADDARRPIEARLARGSAIPGETFYPVTDITTIGPAQPLHGAGWPRNETMLKTAKQQNRAAWRRRQGRKKNGFSWHFISYRLCRVHAF